MECMLLCKSIPPRPMLLKHIQHDCKGSVVLIVVDVIVAVVAAAVAAVVVVVVVTVAVAVVAVVAVATVDDIVSEIKLDANKFAKICKFCVETPIIGCL